MKVNIHYPRWNNITTLLEHIYTSVCEEGGDGWGWITCNDPDKYSYLFEQMLKQQKVYTIRTKKNQMHIICTPEWSQQAWIFTRDKIDDQNLKTYDVYVEII